MMKPTTLSIRTERDLKEKVEHILSELGLNHSTAINMYYKLIVATNGIPFEVRMPNRETARAIEDSRKKKNSKRFSSTSALFDDLGI